MPGGVTINVKIEDREVLALLDRIQQRAGNLTPAMKIVGKTIRDSVRENFRAGGRPERWKSSQRAIIEGKKTLIDTKRLMNSITYMAHKDRAEVGTNVVYAAIQQFGGTVKARKSKYLKFKIGSRWVQKREVSIPARPFMMIQDEDWREIKETLLDYIARERK